MIRMTYPARHLGSGISVNAVIVASAGAMAPTLGGYILAVAPWPYVFASAAPFAVVSLLLGRALPDPERRDVPYDVLGALLCALTFGLTIGGFEGVVHGDSPMVALGVAAAGLSIGTIFIRRELKELQPILPVDLLMRPVIALSAAGSFCAFVGSMTCLLSLPFRLQHDYGLPPAEIGTMIGCWPLMMLVCSPLAGVLSDRVPAGVLGGIGMIIATAGLFLVAFLPQHPGFIDVAWRMMMCGIGFGLYTSPNARLILGSAPRERAAVAGGLVATTRLTGQTVGATVLALLLALGVGTGSTPQFVAAGLTVVAFLCSVARLRPAVHNPKRRDVPDL
jgi:DHA2 family multidrug resistance protein-like MFS transporter